MASTSNMGSVGGVNALQAFEPDLCRVKGEFNLATVEDALLHQLLGVRQQGDTVRAQELVQVAVRQMRHGYEAWCLVPQCTKVVIHAVGEGVWVAAVKVEGHRIVAEASCLSRTTSHCVVQSLEWVNLIRRGVAPRHVPLMSRQGQAVGVHRRQTVTPRTLAVSAKPQMPLGLRD
jgi:hypothetical protein